ncbi:VCBS repeat-containing protein [Dokdonia sp. Hel_I_53]|uniref:VCBS repeat-containing protein n=1 Tax=Dokdonia sp. Hel_I_53 TaxID=1566287 RepID=UPI001199CEE3|nr:VCBS repeat-containing protein [Dokdonia sp. Hel_I_53]TVZ52906.1 FG-GAP repeat protein [Dokdonia sp. Hel_I_53]
MIKNSHTIIGLLICCFFLSCNTDKSEASTKLFSLLDSKETGIDVINKVVNTNEINIFKYRNFYNGGGVAIGDINNDGLADIYFTVNSGENYLYLNKGDFTFIDITEKSKAGGTKAWSTGVTMADVNADGLLDIYVANAGNLEGDNHHNELFINNGDLTFREEAKNYNLADTGFTIHSTFFDYDKDGDLDVYILNNSNVPVNSLGYEQQREKRAENWDNVPIIFRGKGDLLLRNDGESFTDVTKDSGIYGSLIGFGLGVSVTDINNDLYPDIYITNDFYERDYLYINNKDGTFKEDIKNWTSHLGLSAMGVDIADINNDGFQDIFITDMLPEDEERVKTVMEFEGYNLFKRKQKNDFYKQYIQNTLQLNNGNSSFSEIAYYSGVEATDWSWSSLLFDMDNDGYRDIFVTNGINHDLTDLDFVNFMANDIIKKMMLTGKKEAVDSIINKMPVKPLPNYAYHNQRDLTFKNEAKNWGLGKSSMSNGAAYGDLDNDGDLDLVVNNVNMPSFIYKNNSELLVENNYIKLKFEGAKNNPFAVGTTIRLYHSGQTILQEHIPSRGFQSSMEYGMTIGLGQSNLIDSLRIIWPNDQTQILRNIEVNQELALNIAQATEKYIPKTPQPKETLLTEVSNTRVLAHKENNYNDFDYEGLIAKKLSQEGPALAVGDVNGDGNEDIFLGGAKDQEGKLYLHKGNGKLEVSPNVSFSKATIFEDTAASFIDVNNDGHLDLVVATGGNQVGGSSFYKPRLYLNEGNGTFQDAIILPSVDQSMSTITPYDYDQDGDIDLFIASRSTTAIYGIDPTHLFLKNDGEGNFEKDNINSKILANAGMITDAQWIDLNQDGIKELITVADWGAIKMYQFEGARLREIETNLSKSLGWWNTISAADLDKDGDLDLVIGNSGTNIHYKPTKTSSLRMYVNDFDNNGTIEQITTYEKEGNYYPIHQKKEITTQLSSLKKKNLKASDYAKRSIDELFPKHILDKSIIKEVTTASSIIAVNNGNNDYEIKPLPARVQFSCICGVVCVDINSDGNLDLVMGGNNFEYKPQYSQQDAGYGAVLLGDGHTNFEWQEYTTSGFFIREELKHLSPFEDKNGAKYLIAAINDGKPRVFKID